jgi:hypothetical protein
VPGPGEYRPDSTEGITRIDDLPRPNVSLRSRNYRRRPCPRCGHSLDLRLAATEPLPKGLQRFGPLAIADEHHRSAVQVQDHRQVAVPLGDGDLVDGEVAQVLELGLGEATREVALLGYRPDCCKFIL